MTLCMSVSVNDRIWLFFVNIMLYYLSRILFANAIQNCIKSLSEHIKVKKEKETFPVLLGK